MSDEVKQLTPDAAWKAALGELEQQMTKSTFNAWLKDAVLIENHEQTYCIGLRNERAREWVEARLGTTVGRTLSAIVGQAVEMRFVVTDDKAPTSSGVHRPDDRQEVQTAVKTHQASGNGHQPALIEQPPPEVKPPRKRNKSSSDADDNAPIRYRNIRPPTDPLDGFIKMSHYANRFWRPFLGNRVFELHTIISGFSYEIRVLHKPGPSLKLIAAIMQCDHFDLVGRPGAGDKSRGTYREGKEGWLNVLRDHRICDHHSEGHGRGQKQYFDYLTEVDNLPLLTPKQVAQLPQLLRDVHREWLELHTGIDYEEWLKDERESAISEFPLVERPQ